MDSEERDMRRRRMAQVGVGALLVALLFGGWAVNRPSEPTAADRAELRRAIEALAPSTVEVKYEMFGDAFMADATRATPTGTDQGRMTNGSGRTYTFERGAHIYLSLQKGDEAGAIGCRIKVDGQVVAENRSYGAYSIATCSGTAN